MISPWRARARLLYQYIIAVHDVLIAHGVSAHLERKYLAISDYVAQRDGFVGFRCLDRLTGRDPPQ